ncbi:hypothetical protein IWW38_002838 [Coemansia aciculifera]|uniref:Uncharacterized protein n=1 Tax=Coemansia aciculifera TaxID=417176 RepID=A0ACC1M2D9_9FUNG|nr:hypothetical protein IWW38_002838 [Coemansia aciculifera]
MNRQIQLWWLGTNAEQVKLVQTTAFVGVPNKSMHLFTKLAWADQGRCLTVAANFLPTAILVLRSSGHGKDMSLAFPDGYSLGEEQTTLSLVAAMETRDGEGAATSGLSVYGVHTRLVQQLQIDDFKPVEHDVALPDPAVLYSAAPAVVARDGHVRTISNAAPIEESPLLAEDTPIMPPLPQIVPKPAAVVPDVAAVNALPASLEPGLGLNESIAAVVSEQLQLQLPGIAAVLQSERTPTMAVMDPEAEAKLVDRISTEVERRVTLSVATAMEQTLIPAYSRATAAMFEQMQATFESGLHEWWMRVTQMMPPPPPPPIATPLSHMAMMPPPPPQNQAPAPSNMLSMGEVHHHQQQQQQHMVSVMSQQGLPHTHAMNVPRPAATAGPSHIDSLRSILNLQPPPPQQHQQQHQHQHQLMDSAIAAHGQKTNNAQMHN